jgi:predicted nucleic acid-binding protein
VIVSNTSPLRALAHLQLLDVLDGLFGEVLVPPAVVGELVAPRGASSPVRVADFAFLRVVAPSDVARVATLRAHLDPGESEALALAEEVGATTLLMDERLGRAEAARLRIPTTGTLGVLLNAKQAGLIGAVVPLAERLRNELKFFASDVLLAQVRRLAGE